MAATYEPIATTTLGSNANITFSSIPATYTDLRIVIIGSSSASSARLTFNNDTGTNYSYTWINGDGSTATSTRGTSLAYVQTGPLRGALTYTLLTIDIFSYAGSTNKTLLWQFNNDQNGVGNVNSGVGLWRSTSAITEINLKGSGATGWLTGTTATLYGILKA